MGAAIKDFIMQKKKYILPHLVVSALMLLPLAGCKGHSDEPTDGHRSAIQLQVTPRTLATGARAITDAQDIDVPGIDLEDKIIDGQLFIGEDFGLTVSRNFNPEGGNKWSAKFEEKLTDPTSSKHRIAAVINSSRLGLRGSDYTSESTVSLADIDRMIGESFLMSSTFDKEGDNFYTLREDECTKVTLDVERVVSKVQLRRAKEMTGKEMKDTYGLLQPDKMTWAIAGSAKSAYLFTDYAGSLHLGDDGLYKGLKTISAKEKSYGGYDLMKLSDKGLSKNFDARPVSLFESGKVESNNDGGVSKADMIYFLEHALNETDKKSATPYDKTVTYKDVTYVKIYTGLVPTKGFRIDKDKVTFSRHKVFATKGAALDGFAESDPATTSPELLDQQLLSAIKIKEEKPSDRWYWVDVTDTKWFKALSEEDKKNQTIREGNDYYSTDGKAAKRSFLLVHDQPTTFYYGIDDHTIYDTLLAARAGGNSKIRKYEGGTMVYLSPLNEQRTTEKGPVFNCDTRRNNIYDLILNSITGLGLNYDPVDPDDPNIPKPGDNPWEPEPNIPPINGRENVIRITATPLRWNTMDHTMELK